MAALKDSSDAHGELLFATQADIQAGTLCGLLCFNRAGVFSLATMRAESSIGPAQFFEIRAGLVLVVEDRIGDVSHG